MPLGLLHKNERNLSYVTKINSENFKQNVLIWQIIECQSQDSLSFLMSRLVIQPPDDSQTQPFTRNLLYLHS